MSEKDKEITSTGISKDDTPPESPKEPEDTIEEAAADSAFEEDDGNDDHESPPSNRKSNSNGGFKIIKWFSILVILIAIAYAIFFGWQKWQDFQNQSQKADQVELLKNQLNQQKQSLNQALQQQKQQLQNIKNDFAQSQSHIEQLQQQLRSTQNKIKAQASDKQQDWLFNEAEYLLREASNKLNFSNDAASIIALLQAADNVLSEINDGSLTSVRQAISRDINAVRASGNLDIEGVAIAIETLKSDVSKLELASVQLKSKTQETAVETTETDISSWQHFKNSVSDAASKYYTVHHFEESVRPFISPQRDRLLRENIALNLQTAQLAALQNNQSLYQSNLREVRQWVKAYFKQKPATTSAFLQQLDELLDQSVTLDLPTSLQSYQLISDLSQRQVDQWLNDTDSPDDSKTQSSDSEEEPSA